MLYLYNTKTRQKEEFHSLLKDKVSFYSCGPTVYHYAHLGNLRAYSLVDILKRVLRYNGYTVQHVMNITDVGHLVGDGDAGQDKMEAGSRRENKTAWDIAIFFTEAFFYDIQRLNMLEPSLVCKATEHIPEQIALIQRLEMKGYTYIIPVDGVYYDTSQFPAYVDFARLDSEQLKQGSRVAFVEGKKNVTDFALWKFSLPGEKRQMEWNSPWGIGFPGWHIECSAMSMKYLGERFDIHTGGMDLIPVHHTNEIAQNYGVTGHEVVNMWLHNAFVILPAGEKMAKSDANFLRLDSLLERGYDPLAYRFLLLNTHYRVPLSFSWEAMDAAMEGLEKMRQFVRVVRDYPLRAKEHAILEELQKSLSKAFLSAVNDDLNMPQALAVVFELMREAHKRMDDKEILPIDQILETLGTFDAILGLRLLQQDGDKKISAEVKQLLDHREQARKEKQWILSDELRKKIQALGYEVEDTPHGQRVISRP